VEDAALAFVPPIGIAAKINKARRLAKVLSKAESQVWKGLKAYRGEIKMSGKGKKRRYYQWDHTHGNIEVYDRNGKHVGVMDPQTGSIDHSKRVQGRKINLK
jgi:hypothetical protein